MEPGHTVSADTLRIVQNVSRRFVGKSEGRLLPLETVLGIVETFIARKKTLPASIQQVNDIFGWTVREGDHKEHSYPDRIEIPLKTGLGVEDAHLVMGYGEVVEIVIPLITYDTEPLMLDEEERAFVADAFVEVCRSVRMFLGARDSAEPGRYPVMWWYPFSTLAVAVDHTYDNVELRLLDINEMYYREEIDRGEEALNREMGYAPPPSDGRYVPITVKSWDEFQKRLVRELAQLSAGSHLTIRHRTKQTSLQLMQGSNHKQKIDFLYLQLEDSAESEEAWITDEDEQYLRRMGWTLLEKDGYWCESLVWPELLQTIQITGEEIVEILRRQGAEQPGDLELNANNRWENEKLELKSLTG